MLCCTQSNQESESRVEVTYIGWDDGVRQVCRGLPKSTYKVITGYDDERTWKSIEKRNVRWLETGTG